MATENNKKAVGLNAMLPYAVEDPSPIIDLIFDQVRLAYETGDLQEIILNCDHLAEYSYHQYEASIVKQMTSLVKLKYQFEWKDLKRLVQLAYQVVISPPYDDASVRKDWSQLLLSLFKLKPMR